MNIPLSVNADLIRPRGPARILYLADAEDVARFFYPHPDAVLSDFMPAQKTPGAACA